MYADLKTIDKTSFVKKKTLLKHKIYSLPNIFTFAMFDNNQEMVSKLNIKLRKHIQTKCLLWVKS